MAKMRFEIAKLLMLRKSVELLGQGKVQVGIFGNKNARGLEDGSSLTNAEVGARMEFGGEFNWPLWYTLTGRHKIYIPPRSFLRMPIQTQRKSIFSYIQADLMTLVYEGKIDLLLKRLGLACEKVIDQAFQTSGWGTWSPNHWRVVELKGSDRPLIDTGQLRRSIASRVKAK